MRITSFAMLRAGGVIKTVETWRPGCRHVRHELHSSEQVMEWDRIAAESRAYMDSRTPEQLEVLVAQARAILANSQKAPRKAREAR